MKKLFLSLAVCFLSVASSFAQVEKNTIVKCTAGDISYVEPKAEKQTAGRVVGNILGAVLSASVGNSTTTENHSEYVDAARQAILGGIADARRFQMIDGGGDATCYVEGSISSITSTRRAQVNKDSKGCRYETIDYKGNITGVINIKNAETNAIVKTITINTSAWSDSYWCETADKALGNTINAMKSRITSELNSAFPLYASIVEGSAAKKDK